MTDEDGENRAGRAPSTGRFTAGNKISRGRKPGQSISAELRRQADPEAIAARLLALALDESPDPRNRKIALDACRTIVDRLEGTAVSRSVTMRAEAALPEDFWSLDANARAAHLHAMRERALANAAPLALVDGEDE